jgi:hypothetical protein
MYKHKKKKHPFPTARFLKLSFVYFVVFVMVFSLIDYYALMAFNFLWLLALAAVLGLASGWIHIKKHLRDNIDLVADELL